MGAGGAANRKGRGKGGIERGNCETIAQPDHTQDPPRDGGGSGGGGG